MLYLLLHFPDHWTKHQQGEKLNTYKLLTEGGWNIAHARQQKTTASEIMKTQGIRLANEWVDGYVKEDGDTEEIKQQSIVKNLSCHEHDTYSSV
jgi:hypothetical protein